MEDDERQTLVGEEDQPLPSKSVKVESNVGENGGYEEQGDQDFVNNEPEGSTSWNKYIVVGSKKS